MAAYKQYNKDGKEITPKDLQNKVGWCRKGEKIEEAFVSKFGRQLNLIINPQKAFNKYAPDLHNTRKQTKADLKTQNTPFFKAEELYGIDATYAVVFNQKDAERYERLYPEIVIYFWIEWHSIRFVGTNFEKSVDFLSGVYKIRLCNLLELCDVAPKHQYQQRVDDTLGNAKISYVLDIRDEHFIKVI